MKVLVIHQHYNTPQHGGAIRSYYLAKALVDHGHTPVVITAHSKDTYEVTTDEGIEVHYLPIGYNNKYGFWKRSQSFLRFAWGAARLGRSIPGVDLCYAISVPLTVGLVAQNLKRRAGIPYIFEVGDLWPDAPIQMGFIRDYFFKRSLYSLERSVYREAQSIVALSPMIQAAIDAKVPDKTIHLIPNMADTDFYRPEAKDPSLEETYQVKDHFVVSYVGAIGIANGLDFFLECARASQKAALPVKFLICGEGAMLPNLKRAMKQLQLENVTFIPFQNREGVRHVMNITDASFVCYKPVPILETGSPNKYFDGLAAGKLIVINFGGWIKEEIVREGCGFRVDSRDPSEFVTRIRPYVTDRALLKECQQAGRSLAENKYSRKQLGEKFASLFR